MVIYQDCVYFTLQGVAVADPAVGTTPWFAIPRSQYGATDAYAMLLTSKVAGLSLHVATTGQSVGGGYAQVNEIYAN